MTDRTSSETETIPVADLPLYWQGWANAIRLMEERRVEPEMAALRQADAYEKCAKELRAALAGPGHAWLADEIALDAAHQIEALPNDLHEAQRTARIQLLVLDAMRGYAPCPDQWQPIETAPKSKTVILFAVTDIAEAGRIRNWMMATGWWHPGYENDPKVTPWCWEGHQVPKYGVQPTHWMPLPEAPTVPDTSIGRECACMRGGYPLGNCAECDDPKARDAALSHSSTDRKHTFVDAGFDTCRFCGERESHADHPPFSVSSPVHTREGE